MNTERRGDDATGLGDEAIRSAFDAYRAESAANFPPGSVDDLIMSGPARLRRRRIVSLAAVVGACTAVTAGGFAVAQTLGTLPKQTAQEDPPAAVSQGAVGAEDGARPELNDPYSPEASEGSADVSEDSEGAEGPETTIVVADWDEVCDGGEFVLDFSTWTFTEETDWAVQQSVVADVTGDEVDEVVLALTCGEHTAVAAFGPDGDDLRHLGWVWTQPDRSQRLSEIEGVEAGVITLQGLGDASETWTARYGWDGTDFVEIEDEPTTDPSPSGETGTPDPDETLSSPAETASDTRGS